MIHVSIYATVLDIIHVSMLEYTAILDNLSDISWDTTIGYFVGFFRDNI